jgi:hypothetical protein
MKIRKKTKKIRQGLIDAIDDIYYQFYNRAAPTGTTDIITHIRALLMLVFCSLGPLFLITTRIAMWAHFIISQTGFIMLGIVFALIEFCCFWYFRIRNGKYVEVCSNHKKFSNKKYKVIIFYAYLFLFAFTSWYTVLTYGTYTSHYTHPELWE